MNSNKDKMANDQNMYLCAGLVLLAGVAAYFYFSQQRKEGFTGLAAGAVTNIGVTDTSGAGYSPIEAPDGGSAPVANFADLISDGEDYMNQYVQEPDVGEKSMRPMERLDRMQGSALMPRVSTNVTPYNMDLANPSVHRYHVSAPRVASALRSRYADFGLSTAIRGDLNIRYHPDVPVIAKTHQGRDDLRLDGLFTPHFQSLYNKYTGKGDYYGGYRNLPVHIAGSGEASGYGGSGGGVIMDGY